MGREVDGERKVGGALSRGFEIHAWALYDFARHVFAMNMLSLYFVFWVTKDMGAPDLACSLAISGSMLAVALFSPAVGAYSDRIGKRTSLIALFTLVSCAATASIALVIPLFGKEALVPALVLFGVANLFYNLAQVCYNAQLPELAPIGKLGWLSGYGTGIGYLGAILGVLLVMPFVTGKLFAWRLPVHAGGNVGAFVPTAVFFLLLSLPHCLLVRDRIQPTAASKGLAVWTKFWQTWKLALTVPGMGRYLLANLLFFDALNTVVGFMGVYAVKVVGLDELKQEVQAVLMLATLFAVAGSLIWGSLCDRLGAKRALQADLMLWVLALLALIGVHGKAVLIFGIGPLVGIAMGGTWTASRILLSNMAPAARQAEFFGLYALSGKFAAIIGPMTWGIVTYAFAGFPVLKYQLALAAQLSFVLVGLGLLAKVPDPRALPMTASP